MAQYKAQASFKSSSTEVKYSMFVGRWQPLHPGHLWLINERLKEGKNVWLAIRDVKPDEKNPWTAQEIEKMVHEGELKDLIKEGKVVTSIIPDIESINYGRGVGYDIIEHIPPTEIGEISATSIRNQMRKDGKL
jgi:cytidyltransferase-like protein